MSCSGRPAPYAERLPFAPGGNDAAEPRQPQIMAAAGSHPVEKIGDSVGLGDDG